MTTLNNPAPKRSYRERARDIRETVMVAASFIWMGTTILTLVAMTRAVWRIW